MNYKHIRHATGILYYAGLEILIDPMLAPKEVYPPIKNSWNDRKNPLVDLPMALESFNAPEYCLVTHLHQDHFDGYAGNHLAKNINLICQAENAEAFKDMGFLNMYPMKDRITIQSVSITRVAGQHGTGQIAELMGISSGYILEAPNEPTIYLTGDTVYYDKVQETVQKYSPDVIIAFGGCAQFSQGDPITLSTEDILSLHQDAPDAKIICVHMDTLNHCRTTREGLIQSLTDQPDNYKEYFLIPNDGEYVDFK
ncbi:MAG TPA: MBL fold metallo-hydrolase [Lachnospiraceae bacterium]|nr:MBL fold metallo-hydrolase [Lachnospiraceae bacterium]